MCKLEDLSLKELFYFYFYFCACLVIKCLLFSKIDGNKIKEYNAKKCGFYGSFSISQISRDCLVIFFYRKYFSNLENMMNKIFKK